MILARWQIGDIVVGSVQLHYSGRYSMRLSLAADLASLRDMGFSVSIRARIV